MVTRPVSRRLALSVIALFAVIPFQNCGQQMKSSTVAGSSQQCKAQMKAEAVDGVEPSAFRCGTFNNYACDRRIFSPDVADMSHLLKECIGEGETCVDVDVRQYNTAAARNPADEEMFSPGGSYNREEIRCHHKYFYRGVAVFEGEGDSLSEALAAAMKACESAGDGS